MPEDDSPASAGPPTAGGLIRAARQAQGLDLASLAAMLKIPLRKLEALESSRHDELPGATFERALAQAACRVLKIDPKPVLALLPQVAGDTLENVTGGLNRPFREHPGHAETADASALLRPVVLVPVLMVVAALVLFFVPNTVWDRLLHPVQEAVAPSAPASVPEGGASGAAIGAAPASAAVTTAAADVSPAASTPAAALAASAPAPAASQSTRAAQGEAAPAAVAPAAGEDEVVAHSAPPPNIPLQVNAVEDTWVEVLDAQGRMLLSRTVVAGESVGLDGALPMKVKVGNARGTRLTLRGDNVDLTPYTRDNVARLELK